MLANKTVLICQQFVFSLELFDVVSGVFAISSHVVTSNTSTVLQLQSHLSRLNMNG